MHTGFTVDFDHAWLAGRDFARDRGRTLLRLLAELAQSGSLREAARRASVSYRSAWDALATARDCSARRWWKCSAGGAPA